MNIDGDYANGEIDFFGIDTNGNGRYEQSEITEQSGQAFAVRVIPPGHKVDFGLAGAIGFDSVSVTEPATALVGSPLGLGIPPFYLTVGDNGPTCIKDDAPGGGPAPSLIPHWGVKSFFRAANPLLSSLSPSTATVGSTIRVNGADFGNGDKVSFGTQQVPNGDTTVGGGGGTCIDVVVPGGIGDVVPVTVKSGSFTSAPLDFTVIPTITRLNPVSGPVGISVTVTGTGLPVAVAAGATFDGVPASDSIAARTYTQWSVVVPAGVSGNVPVQISFGSKRRPLSRSTWSPSSHRPPRSSSPSTRPAVPSQPT